MDIFKNRFLRNHLLSSLSICSLLYLTDICFPTALIPVIYITIFCFFEKYKLLFSDRTKESKVLAFLFSLFLLLDSVRYDTLSFQLKSIFLFLATFAGIFALLVIVLDVCFCYLKTKQLSNIAPVAKQSVRKIRCISFSLLWVVYFFYFLNQYPGSLSCDTPGQLMQALGYAAFENANPFINTLVLTICVRTGQAIGGSVNAGVATYTVFQLTLVAVCFSYTVATLYKHNFPNALVVFAQIFFNLVPYNIVYAAGMWKDTFFAVLFLAAITHLFDFIMCEQAGLVQTKRTQCTLFLLVFLASLSRNSGWSSFLVFGMVLFLLNSRYKAINAKLLSMVIMSGALLAVTTITLVYPWFGITDNGNITTGLSVPLQQLARVVTYDGNLSSSERAQIDWMCSVEDIPELYDEQLSDPIKWSVNTDVLEQNFYDYIKLWIKVGIKNPKIYLDAYIQQTKNYWSLDSSFWYWDNRIFENEVGVVREAKIFPECDLTELLDVPYANSVIYSTVTSAFALWVSMFFFTASLVRKNAVGAVLYVPIFMVFIGLMLSSPVALFRYTYSASVCIPMMISFPFCNRQDPTVISDKRE